MIFYLVSNKENHELAINNKLYYMNTSDQTTFKEFIKQLSLLHLAMTLGASMVLVLVYFTAMDNPQFDMGGANKIYFYICVFLTAWGIFGGQLIFNKKLQSIDASISLEDRLAEYRAARIVQFALSEGAALICIVLGMEENNLVFLMLALVMIVYLFSLRVTEYRVVNDLSLEL